ncbi:MAG: hypothetical protein WA104_00250 [Thermodesulfovibrionales bacterium]
MMKEQHKAILKELIAGKYPVDGAEEEKKEEPVSVASMAEPEMKKIKDKTLDDILLDYIMQREKKR